MIFLPVKANYMTILYRNNALLACGDCNKTLFLTTHIKIKQKGAESWIMTTTNPKLAILKAKL